jgi:hypothetical protein
MKRLERIRKIKEQQQADRMRELVRTKVKPEDVREVHAWLGRYANAHEEELLALLGSEMQQQLRRVPEGFPRQMALFRALQRRPPDRPLPQPTAEQLEDLRGRLSEEARQVFDSIPEDKKLTLILQWIRDAFMTRFMPPPVSTEELEDFFTKKLDGQQREFLEQKPREQFQEELRRMYWMHKMRGGDGEFRPPFFRRGEGRPHYRNGEGPPRGGGSRGPYRGRPGNRPDRPGDPNDRPQPEPPPNPPRGP